MSAPERTRPGAPTLAQLRAFEDAGRAYARAAAAEDAAIAPPGALPSRRADEEEASWAAKVALEALGKAARSAFGEPGEPA